MTYHRSKSLLPGRGNDADNFKSFGVVASLIVDQNPAVTRVFIGCWTDNEGVYLAFVHD